MQKKIGPVVATCAFAILLLGSNSPRALLQAASDWPSAWEREFQQRKETIIRLHAEQNDGRLGNTFFENEKQSYPNAMFTILAGELQNAPVTHERVEAAIRFLQERDNLADVDNAHTLGIDLYPSFTLKGQVRKYFLFGDLLDDNYRQQMTRAMKIWTEKDPHHRPHPKYGNGNGGQGWRPEDRGGWVDVRGTDNLKAMRETSVYLFAEAVGNEDTRLLYKQRLHDHVAALYHIGMSEWDSENYLGHSLAPFLNLFDFARDPEVKETARAALDWYSAAAAVKYYRGGWGGPTKRDYGGANVVFGSAAAKTFWAWFGDCPVVPDEVESDLIHVLTSDYRPPRAIVELAHKNFARPATLRNTKPAYGVFAPDAVSEPMYFETMHFGDRFALGSVVSDQAQSDVGPMKLTVDNKQRGVDFLVINTAPGDTAIQQCPAGKREGDQVTQNKNILSWLRQIESDNDASQWVVQFPRHVKYEKDGTRYLLQFEDVYALLVPLNLSDFKQAEITGKHADLYADERLLIASGMGDGLSGLVLVVGEKETHGSYMQFKRDTRQMKFELSSLADEEVLIRLDTTSAAQIIQRYNPASGNDMPIGYDKETSFDIYCPLDDAKGPIFLGWKTGTLKVQAGGATFERTFGP